MACGERVLKKLDQARRAFEKLKAVPDLRVEREILYEISAKRFEYTYEVLWKAVRLFLLEEKGLECNSPMDCFKAPLLNTYLSGSRRSVKDLSEPL